MTKATRFFLSAMDDAGISYSPHLKPPKKPKPSRGRRKPAPSVGPDSEKSETGEVGSKKNVTRQGWKAHPFHLPTRSEPIEVIAPDDLTEGEWAMVNAFMEGYIKLSLTKK